MIRRADMGDIPAINALLFDIQRIHAEGRPDIFKKGEKKFTDAELSELLRDDDRPVFVFSEGGEVLGYIFCEKRVSPENDQRYEYRTLFIEDLCVSESARSRGVGRALYEYARDLAKSEGLDSVTLNVWELNGGARAFYERLGMEPMKTVMEERLR